MGEALKGSPVINRRQPEGMVTVRIDPRTGARATASTEGAIFEVFRAEEAPGAAGAGSGGIAAPALAPTPVQDLF